MKKIILLTFLLTSKLIFACSCDEYTNIQEEFSSADFIVIGKVKVKMNQESYIAPVKVLENYKGKYTVNS